VKTTFAWSFSLAFHPFALPTIEAHMEMTEDDEQPEPEQEEQSPLTN
jgi:hypothetical protein